MILFILFILITVTATQAQENLREVIGRAIIDGEPIVFTRGDLRQLESDVQVLSAQVAERFNKYSKAQSKMNFCEIKITIKNRQRYIDDLLAEKNRLKKEIAKPIISNVVVGYKTYVGSTNDNYQYGDNTISNNPKTTIKNAKPIINSLININDNNSIRETKSPDGETLYTNLKHSQFEDKESAI